MRVELLADHSYIPELVRADGVVFDFGVNHGAFAREIAGRCGRVIGYEPDPRLVSRLTLPPNVTLMPYALTAAGAPVEFHLNDMLCPSIHFRDRDAGVAQVDSRTLAGAIAEVPNDRIDLVKLDIEGEELPVLLGASDELLVRVTQFTVEFHEFLDPTCRPQIETVLLRLKRLGFYVFCFSRASYGDVLFVNRRHAQLSVAARAWMVARYKYARGFGRITKRRLNRA